MDDPGGSELQRSPLPRSPNRTSHAAAPTAVAVNVDEHYASVRTEAGTGELAAIEQVDGKLERLAQAAHADEAIHIGNAGSQRMAIAILALVVLAQKDTAARRDTNIVGRVEHAAGRRFEHQ